MTEFRWAVSRSGYAWELDRGDDEFVRQLITYDTGEGVWVYEPMKANPDLFLKFAELAGDDEGYLRFAAQSGQLTRAVTVVERPKVESDEWRDDVSTLVRYPHPPSVSQAGTPPQFNNLEAALSSPNGCHAGTRFDTKMEMPRRAEDSRLWANHATEMKGLIRLWQAKPDGDAREEVRQRIEAVLDGRAVFAFDSKTGQPSLAPTDLLSALWLQFAFAVGGARRYEPCQRCAKLFPVSVLNPETGRRVRNDKAYCTPECQMAAAYALRKPKRQKAAAARTKRKRSFASRRKSGR
jgi:hypothetical protein